jgi:hypothetical protein
MEGSFGNGILPRASLIKAAAQTEERRHSMQVENSGLLQSMRRLNNSSYVSSKYNNTIN